MLFLLFSDVHSNLEALETLVKKIKEIKPDKVICLGDIVGYGADPKICLEITKDISDEIVAGNHDWAAVKKFNIEYFNQYAKEAILWTRERLNHQDKLFLENLPLTNSIDNFEFVHSSLWYPERFDYIFEPVDTLNTFKMMKHNLCFIGHTHVPISFVLNEEKKIIFKCLDKEIPIQNDQKYIINVGSVGQPRDRDPRLSFCIYDSSKQIVKILRLEYNIKKAQEKILKENLPPILAIRLGGGV